MMAMAFGLFAFILITWTATIEGYLLLFEPFETWDVLRIASTGWTLGFLPTSLAVYGVCRLRDAQLTVGMHRFLYSTSPFLGLLFILTYARAHEWIDDLRVAGTLLVFVVAAFILSRHLSFFRKAQGHLTPLLLSWLLASIVLGWISKDQIVDPGWRALELVVCAALGSVLAPLAAQGSANVWEFVKRHKPNSTHALATALVLAALAISLVAIWFLQAWLPGLNLRQKLWVILTLALGLGLVCWGPLDALARRYPRALVASMALPLVGVIGSVWILQAPLPERFGAYPSRSSVGTVVALYSAPWDRDGDGFYSVAIGGNDCDDRDGDIHPAALDPSKNCSAPAPIASFKEHHRRPPTQARAENVFIFIIDSLRGDLFADATTRSRFPHLDNLANESLRFDNAYAPSPSTATSIPAMLTSISSLTVVQSLLDPALAFRDLIEPYWLVPIGADDYCTAVINQAPWPWISTYFPTEVDVRIFDTKVDDQGRSVTRTPEHVAEALEGCAGRPLFWILYLFEPHARGTRYLCRDGSHGGYPCYLESIDLVDEALGEMLGLLEDANALEKAMVVVTADHGEGFEGDHYLAHSSSVFNSQVHVPLFVRLPDVLPQTITQPVALAGLPATVADALGLNDDIERSYPSWLTLVDPAQADGDPLTYPPFLVENWMGYGRVQWQSPSSAIIIDEWKLIYDWVTTHVRLYNLNDDPRERTNLSVRYPERAVELRDALLSEHMRLIEHAFRLKH